MSVPDPMLNLPFPTTIADHFKDTGYSAEMLLEGFRRVWHHLKRADFETLICREAPELLTRSPLETWLDASLSLETRRELYPECSAHELLLVTASTVPSAAFQDALVPLILPVRVTLRPAHNLVPLMRELVHWVTAHAPELGKRLTVCDTGHDVSELKSLIARHDALNVSGSDETIERYSSLCTPQTPIRIYHGHRLSAFMLFRGETDALSEKDADALAEDLSVWDQTGCLSPKIIFTEDGLHQAKALAERLCAALDRVAVRFPEVAPSLEALAQKNSRLRMAAFDGASLFKGTRNHDVVAVHEPGAPFEPILLPRTTSIYCVENAIEAAKCLSPRGQAMGSLKPLNDGQEKNLREAGFNYFCRPGFMQDPPLYWFHDNIGTLKPLL